MLASLQAIYTGALHLTAVELLWGLESATGHGPCSRPFVLLDMSSAFDLITWMSLISLPCGSTLYNNVILFGKAWIFVQGLVLVKALGVAHMPDGLQGLHTNMLGLYWIFLSLPHVSNAFLGSVWVVIVSHGMRGHGLGLRFPDLKGSVSFVG